MQQLPYISGNSEASQLLEELYGDIDAVELYVGLMAEKRRDKGLFGMTLYDMFGAFSIKLYCLHQQP